jgi:C1q domain
MKTLIFALLTFTTIRFAHGQNIGIGTNTPAASAQLDISSTTRGLLAPRMTTTQRNAIVSPAKGLLVYDTDLNALYHYNGSAWAPVGGGGGFTLPYSGSMANASPLLNIANTGDGKGITASSVASFTAAIEGTGNGTGGFGVVGNSMSLSGYGIYGLNPTGTAVYGFSASGGVALRGNSPTGYALLTNGNLRLTGGNTNPAEGAVLTSVDANGNAVWKPGKIAFSVLNTANTSINANTWRKIEFVNEAYDLGNAFQPYAGSTTDASSVFTAPVDGIYHFDATVYAAITSPSYNIDRGIISLYKNGVEIASKGNNPFNLSTASQIFADLSLDVQLNAGDKIWVMLFQSNDGNLTANTQNVNYKNSFSGHLVFAE